MFFIGIEAIFMPTQAAHLGQTKGNPYAGMLIAGMAVAEVKRREAGLLRTQRPAFVQIKEWRRIA